VDVYLPLTAAVKVSIVIKYTPTTTILAVLARAKGQYDENLSKSLTDLNDRKRESAQAQYLPASQLIDYGGLFAGFYAIVQAMNSKFEFAAVQFLLLWC